MRLDAATRWKLLWEQRELTDPLYPSGIHLLPSWLPGCLLLVTLAAWWRSWRRGGAEQERQI